MKIFPKTFLYTLSLLVLIAVLASGLIYTLMPAVYAQQMQQTLCAKTDSLVQRLNESKQQDIVGLMGGFVADAQANVSIEIGGDRYSLIIWSDASEADGMTTTYVTITSTSGTADGVSARVYSDTGAQSESEPVSKGAASVESDAFETSIEDDSGSVSRAACITATAWEGSSGSEKTITVRRNFIMEENPGSLTVSMTLAPVREAASAIVSLLPASLVLCVVIAVLFSFVYTRALVRPIKAISEETFHMTRLEKDAQCNVTSKDEFGELAANVNDLYRNLLNTINNLEAELKKTAAAEQAKTDFLRAASHELKTPVTAASVILDNMILGVGKYKNQQEWLPKCKELVDKLSDMLREILDATHLSAIAETDTTAEIKSVCADILEPYVIIARAKGLSLYIDWSASFAITAPTKMLGKALSNIFSNAVTYTVPGGKLGVYCRERSLIVENTCEPIPEDRLRRLFEPFYRPDDSRDRQTGGNGLGLYITDRILRLLGLDFSFLPTQDGMRFTIHF